MAGGTGSASSVDFDLYPDFRLTLKLFKDVKNVADVKRKTIKGDIPASLLRPCLITNCFSVMVAANKAIHNLTTGKMKTKSIHTEIIYSLSPTHNISESLKNFGVHDNDSELLMAFVHKEGDQLEPYVGQVNGTSCEEKFIEEYSSKEQIKKLYKITDEELEIGTLADAVVCRIAVKDAG